jgi:hypothetical protein
MILRKSALQGELLKGDHRLRTALPAKSGTKKPQAVPYFNIGHYRRALKSFLENLLLATYPHAATM